MMYFYGLGVVGVFGVLALVNWRAYHLRDELELDELKRFLTRVSVRTHLITVGIAVLSMVVLVIGDEPGWAGVTYFLMAPLHFINGFVGASRAEKIQQRL